MTATVTATETATDERAADGGLTLERCLDYADHIFPTNSTADYLARACRLLAARLEAVEAELAALKGE